MITQLIYSFFIVGSLMVFISILPFQILRFKINDRLQTKYLFFSSAFVFHPKDELTPTERLLRKVAISLFLTGGIAVLAFGALRYFSGY